MDSSKLVSRFLLLLAPTFTDAVGNEAIKLWAIETLSRFDVGDFFLTALLVRLSIALHLT